MSNECTCPYTPPETWLSAASCGYGGGYEPGSMQEWNPDCPVHPATPAYRPGDIAVVKWDEREEHVAVAISNGPDCRVSWMSPETHYWTVMPHEVGPVLGNVADIAAMMTKAHEAFEEPIDLDDPYTVAYVKGRNHRLDEIAGLQGQVREAKSDALREAANNLYLADEGQHNQDAKNWLHRRANLIDPRTRGSVCEHGYPQSDDCGYCAQEAP